MPCSRKVVGMFGFKKTSESDRLRAVYADQSDGELLRLFDERDGLTDAAKEALTEAIKQRGLEAVANDTPEADEPNAEDQGGLRDELGPDEVPVYTFSDTYQLRDMLGLLEEANIAFRLEDYSDTRSAGLFSTRQTGVTVIVENVRAQEAKACLRQILFASSLDQDETPALHFTPPSGLVLLLTCDRADALRLVPALSEGGISFYWRDGREDDEVPGEEVVAIEVHAAQRKHADEIVQRWASATETKENESTPDVDREES